MTDPAGQAPGRRKPKARPKNRWGCGILIAPLIVLAGLGALGSKAWGPSRADYPVQGIDVSHHQGDIRWTQVAGEGVDFAYIKATEGGDFTDPAFAANWQAAATAGIKRGAYHFFTLCRPGAEQAAHFIATVPVEPDALAPAVDLEFLGNCAQRPKLTDVQGELTAFLALVEAHYGQQAVLYLTGEFDEAYNISARFDRPLWLRSLVFEPRFGARPWAIWQASNFRRVEGINGRVDWNVMRKAEGARAE